MLASLPFRVDEPEHGSYVYRVPNWVFALSRNEHSASEMVAIIVWPTAATSQVKTQHHDDIVTNRATLMESRSGVSHCACNQKRSIP